MNKTTIRIALAVAAAMLAPTAALANPAQVALKGDVRVEKTVVENGETRTVLVEPKVVVPGDRLHFTTSYANHGDAPVTNFVVTNPLPSAVMLADQSAQALDVSVDGGKSWGRLAALTVDDGKGGKRPAQASDVTHVRWLVASIAPHATGQVEYQAIVR